VKSDFSILRKIANKNFPYQEKPTPMETKRTTKRMVLAGVSLCSGCCCGRVERGHPEVPLDWLKSEWKSRKLLGTVHLAVSGCLGPCDMTNVATVITPEGTFWFGGLREAAHYGWLLDWATAVKEADRVLPFPPELAEFRFDPIRRESPAERAAA
jgi:hypothetical protein